VGGRRLLPEALTEPVWFGISFLFFLFFKIWHKFPVRPHIGPKGFKKNLPLIRQLLNKVLLKPDFEG
jgi:hypothetical protein